MPRCATTQCHLQTAPWAQPLAWGGYSCLLSYLGFFFFFWLLNYACKSICILNLHTKCKWCDCHFFSCSIFVLCRMNTICTFSESLRSFALLASQKIILGKVGRRVIRAFQRAKQWGLSALSQPGVKRQIVHVNGGSMVNIRQYGWL